MEALKIRAIKNLTFNYCLCFNKVKYFLNLKIFIMIVLDFIALFLISFMIPALLKIAKTARDVFEALISGLAAIIFLPSVAAFKIWPNLREFYNVEYLMGIYAAFVVFSLIVGLLLFTLLNKSGQST